MSQSVGQERAERGPAPLSFPQERLFVLDRMMPGVSAYNVPHLVRVGATLDKTESLTDRNSIALPVRTTRATALSLDCSIRGW